MKFKELAWGSFLFKHVAGDVFYQPIASNEGFLNTLRTDPSLGEFQKLRDFLVHYGVPWARKDLANQYLAIWPKLKPFVSEILNERLENCEFSQTRIHDNITAAFDILLRGTWGSDTVVSKVLHFFNTELFMMIDIPIMSHYKKYGSSGYLEFLKLMQGNAQEVLADFKQLELPGTPQGYLSKMLNYKSIRPLTKLIDDFNWVTITKKWPIAPPYELLDLFFRKEKV